MMNLRSWSLQTSNFCFKTLRTEKKGDRDRAKKKKIWNNVSTSDLPWDCDKWGQNKVISRWKGRGNTFNCISPISRCVSRKSGAHRKWYKTCGEGSASVPAEVGHAPIAAVSAQFDSVGLVRGPRRGPGPTVPQKQEATMHRLPLPFCCGNFNLKKNLAVTGDPFSPACPAIGAAAVLTAADEERRATAAPGGASSGTRRRRRRRPALRRGRGLPASAPLPTRPNSSRSTPFLLFKQYLSQLSPALRQRLLLLAFRTTLVIHSPREGTHSQGPHVLHGLRFPQLPPRVGETAAVKPVGTGEDADQLVAASQAAAAGPGPPATRLPPQPACRGLAIPPRPARRGPTPHHWRGSMLRAGDKVHPPRKTSSFYFSSFYFSF